jgi:hypothetical protein|tara:strand:- start:244 stop:453 length:210 start_codon:yes stop_codon:yes gene_type:complete
LRRTDTNTPEGNDPKPHAREKVGLLLIFMMIGAMVALGVWERKRSRRRFLAARKRLREMDATTPSEGSS